MSSEVPVGWSLTTLGSVSVVKARIGWRGLAAKEYTDDGAFLIAGKHIQAGEIDWDGCDHISDERYKESPEIMLRTGDVIFSKDGSIGNPALIRMLPGPATMNGTMMMLRPDPTQIYPEFLFQFVGGPSFARMIDEKVSGRSSPHIFQRDIIHFPTLLPPLDEQQQIAEVLRSVDRAASCAEQSARAARSAFNRLIDDLYSRYEDNSARLTDFCIPKGLQTGPFGSQLKVSDYVDEGIPVIMPSDLRPDGIDYAGAKATSREKADQLSHHLLKPGDIIFSRRGDVEKCGLYLEGDPPALCGTGCLRARIDAAKADPILVYFLVQSDRCGSWLTQHAVGVTMPNLNTSIVGALPVPSLPLLEQKRWVDALLLAEGVCRVSENYIVEAQSLKRALSSDLLSGRVRVPA